MVNLSEKIAPVFYPVHKAIRDETHDEFWLHGGRGSTKSSFISLQIILSILKDPEANAIAFRKVSRTIRDSIQGSLNWAIDELGESENFDSISSPAEITYRPTGQKIILRGLDEPKKLKSIKLRKGYFKILWFEEADEFNGDAEIRSVEQSILRGGQKFIEFLSYNPPRNPNHWINKMAKESGKKLVHHSTYLDVPRHWLGEKFFEKAERLKQNNYETYCHEYLGKSIGNPKELVFAGKYEVSDFETPSLSEIYQSRFFFGADWGFACLKGDTLVKTINGDKQLQDIKVGDYVLTREGYKQVTLFMNKGIKDVYEFDFGLRSPIIVTGDHRIYTIGGWKRVDQLKEFETICTARLNLMGRFIQGILMAKSLITAINLALGKAIKRLYCTEIFGNQFMVKFRMGWLFIISMRIKKIMISITSFAYHLLIMQKYIFQIVLALYQKKSYQKSAKNIGIQKRTGSKGALNQWKRLVNALKPVLSAIKILILPMFTRSFVTLIVGKSQIVEQAKRNMYAKFVKLNLWLHRMIQEKPVLKSARINLRKLEEKSEVFDISVENGEFFANGLLVHNCDPSVLIRCFIKDDCLWIDYEYYQAGVEIDHIGKVIFDKIPESRTWQIEADSSRPETISNLVRQGFTIRGAKKWAGSVEEGVEYLKSFRKIIIHSRCINLAKEFENYSYMVDSDTKDILPKINDRKERIRENEGDKIGIKDDGIDALRYALSTYIKKSPEIIAF